MDLNSLINLFINNLGTIAIVVGFCYCSYLFLCWYLKPDNKEKIKKILGIFKKKEIKKEVMLHRIG